MRRLPQAMAVIVILGTAGLSSRLLSPSVDPQGSQAQPAAGVSVAATAGAAHAAANPDGTPDGTDGCVDAPGAIAGLWFVKNNRKHKPEFFMRRVGELAIQVAKSGLDMAFFHDGREGTNDIVHAKYEQNHPAGQYWDNTVALDDLPYQVWPVPRLSVYRCVARWFSLSRARAPATRPPLALPSVRDVLRNIGISLKDTPASANLPGPTFTSHRSRRGPRGWTPHARPSGASRCRAGRCRSSTRSG